MWVIQYFVTLGTTVRYPSVAAAAFCSREVTAVAAASTCDWACWRWIAGGGLKTGVGVRSLVKLRLGTVYGWLGRIGVLIAEERVEYHEQGPLGAAAGVVEGWARGPSRHRAHRRRCEALPRTEPSSAPIRW
jgi:hypothetical protein